MVLTKSPPQHPFQNLKKNTGPAAVLNETALNARLFTTRLKRDFYHQKTVDKGRSDVWKSFGANGKNEQLDFAAC